MAIRPFGWRLGDLLLAVWALHGTRVTLAVFEAFGRLRLCIPLADTVLVMPLRDQVTSNASRSRATPRQILDSFLDRIQQVSEFRSGIAFISDQPIPISMPLGKLAISVSWAEGQFDQGLFESGGIEQLATESQVVIGVFVSNNRERPGRSNSPILDDGGIVARVEQLLKILLVADPSKGRRSQQWEPTRNGVPLLRSCPRPAGFSQPSDVPGHIGWLGVLLRFTVEFDWELL